MKIILFLAFLNLAFSGISGEGAELEKFDGYFVPESVREKSASMKCTFHGSQNVTFLWYEGDGTPALTNGGNYFIASSDSEPGSSTLNITHVGEKDVGELYTCEAHSTDNNVLGKSHLTLFASPQVSISDHTGQNSIMRVEGEELVLSCTAWGWPIPSVSWKRQDGEKDLSHFQNVTSITNSSQTVTLKIDHLLTTDRAQYVCEGNNSLNGSYATNQKLILVRVKDRLAPLWPFIGIVAEIIVLVVIIIFYERNKSQKKKEEDRKASAENTNPAKDGNLESQNVRQRKP